MFTIRTQIQDILKELSEKSFQTESRKWKTESKKSTGICARGGKNMKKKICMLGLAMSLSMFGLVACGENAEEPAESTPVESVVNASEEASVEATQEASTQAEQETPAESGEDAATVEGEESQADNNETETSTEETETSTEETTTAAE